MRMTGGGGLNWVKKIRKKGVAYCYPLMQRLYQVLYIYQHICAVYKIDRSNIHSFDDHYHYHYRYTIVINYVQTYLWTYFSINLLFYISCIFRFIYQFCCISSYQSIFIYTSNCLSVCLRLLFHNPGGGGFGPGPIRDTEGGWVPKGPQNRG